MTEQIDENDETRTDGHNEGRSMNANNGAHGNAEDEVKLLEELVKKEHRRDNKYRITKGAFNKAMTYAKAIGQIAGTGMECYGYLLKPLDSFDDTVTDISLAPDQTNRAAYVRVSAEGVYQTSQEIEQRGLMIVGWWHSHGTFSTFHSGTDVRNFQTVLHSIAPRTMFRNETAQYSYNPKTKEFITNGTKIKGLEIPEHASLEVVKKVEQDPYAFSMVVNVFRDYYLEKLTKTLVSRREGYHLNAPVRPLLELIDAADDVRYSISEMENDITGKVEIMGGIDADSKRESLFVDLKKNKRTIDSFVNNIVHEYPSYMKGFINGILLGEINLLKYMDSSLDDKSPGVRSPDVQSSAENLSAVEKLTIDPKQLKEVMMKRFEDTPFNYNTKQAYDIKSLKQEIALHFVRAYANNPSSKTMAAYGRVSDMLSADFDMSVKGGKALAKYSMERFTDYKNENGHKYRNFIAHFLDKLNTSEFSSIGEGLKYSESHRYEAASEHLFLYGERLRIINNMVTALTFREEEARFKGFLSDFANEYESNPLSKKLDEIIEQKFLSLGGAKRFTSYADTAYNERKGIINRIFSNVRHYFTGDFENGEDIGNGAFSQNTAGYTSPESTGRQGNRRINNSYREGEYGRGSGEADDRTERMRTVRQQMGERADDPE